MLLGVVSDTHGHLANAEAAARKLAEYEIAAVIHCGDIGGAHIIPVFAEWPTHFVLGNVDDNAAALMTEIAAAGLHYHGRFGELQLGGRSIAFLHSDDSRRFEETIASQQYDLVCYGHTHVAAARQADRTLVLNPGALFRARTHTIAVVNLEDMTAKHVVV
jgi:putative phosphoesterase